MAPASAIHTSSVHIELGQLVAFEHVQQGIFGDNTFGDSDDEPDDNAEAGSSAVASADDM